MTTKVIVRMSCDMPHRKGEHEATQTVRFSMAGRDFEMDLCDVASRQLHQMASRYTAAARKLSVPRASRTKLDREQSRHMRDRLRELGHNVPDRGRLAADLIQKYQDSLKRTPGR